MATFEYIRYNGFYDKQLEILNCTKKFAYILGSNKCGKTFTLSTWIIERAMENDDKQVAWVAPYYKTTKIAFDLCQRLLNESKLSDFISVNLSSLKIKLPNGSTICFLSADNIQSIYGDEYYAIAIDEASRIKKEAYYAVLSTRIYTNACVYMIGNPRFMADWFYQEYLKTRNGEIDGLALKITAKDAVLNGVLGIDVIEDAKKRLAPHIFKRDYCAEIVDDGSNPFGLDNIENCKINKKLKEIKDKIPIKYGIDLAKTTDYTVIIGINKNREICYYARFQESWSMTKELICSLPYVSQTPILMDSTGVGDPILEDLQKRIENIEGYKYTNPTKCHLIENLSINIKNKNIYFPKDLDKLFAELENFERQLSKAGSITYNAHTGHDDIVNALGLALIDNQENIEVSIVSTGDDFYDDDDDDIINL